MLNSLKRVNKASIRKLVFNICMPIILACISFVILITVIYSQIGNPGRYVEILKTTTQSSEKFDLLTLHDIYDGDDAPNPEIPVIIPSEDGSGTDGENPTEPALPDDIENELPPLSDGDVPYPDVGDGDGSGSANDSVGGVTNDGQSVSSIVFPVFNTRYAVFEVPKYNMKYSLYFGISNAALEKGVCQSMGSYLPGYGGTTVVCVHNRFVRQFGSTSKPLESGDEIIIRTNYGVYQYKVTSVSVVDKDELSKNITVSENDNLLKFYTCYPLHDITGQNQRMIVKAVLVSGSMLKK